MDPNPIRVLIADDHIIVRKGIRALIETEADICVVGEVGNGREAVEQAARLHPDVILMDLMMPEMDGIQATAEINRQQNGARILVMTSFAANEQVFPAIKAGAMGYLLKDSTPAELLQALRQVARGESSLAPSIARKVLHELAHPAPQPPTTAPLTEREIEVLRQVAQGSSNREIASRLGISEATVRTHLSSIFSKLHLASRTQAALYAIKEGLAEISPPPQE
jgi:NarL family two-component system response regulator LiaR